MDFEIEIRAVNHDCEMEDAFVKMHIIDVAV